MPACLCFAGIAALDKISPEVSSVPPRAAGGALAARRWLDGQISPPRHLLPPRVHNPAVLTLPLLLPPPVAQENRPTPRLTSAQPDSQVRHDVTPKMGSENT